MWTFFPTSTITCPVFEPGRVFEPLNIFATYPHNHIFNKSENFKLGRNSSCA